MFKITKKMTTKKGKKSEQKVFSATMQKSQQNQIFCKIPKKSNGVGHIGEEKTTEIQKAS